MVVTAFACRTFPNMLLIWRLHRQLKRNVYAKADGFLGVHLILNWCDRVVQSISLWSDLHALYDMGEVKEHVRAVRVPGTRGIQTSCGVFGFDGDWLSVLFGSAKGRPSPLSDWQDGQRPAANGDKEKHRVPTAH